MRFKKLELLGFKSFAEQTELIFEPGVTAVVGPNGCGKSNVADAIKWVLGEQSPRELRGGRMEDLIFNGSDRREPIHFAEVSLTLDNSEKKLPIDFAEVVISRRLFRNGESEYLLNRSAVRLKDIQEMLMGTGIGTSAYSLFEQGRIEQLISARPEDRRVVFEEAAGITKFKSQKREAMRRLEETEENLARVSDVIAEVKRQTQALDRQVRRAKAYREQMEELKKLEVGLARQEQGRLAALWQEKEASLQAFRQELSGLEEQAAGQESSLAQARGQGSEAEESFSRAREGLLAVTHRQEAGRNNLQVNRERIAEGQNRSESAREEIAGAEKQLGQLQEQIRQLRVLVGQEEEERLSKEGQITRWETQLAGCARMIDEAQAVIGQAREQLLDLTGSEVQVKNQLARVRQESARLEARAGRLQAENGKVSHEQQEAGSKVENLRDSLLQIRAVMEQLERERTICQESLASTDLSLEDSERETGSLGAELNRVGSRLEALKGLMDNHEGYSSGVKALLKAMDEGIVAREGVNGVLAELIHVDRNDMAAVDAALGPWAEAVVVDSASAAQRCRQFLESSAAGRVLFLIRDQVPNPLPEPDPSSAVALLDRVGITPHLQPLLQLILSDDWWVLLGPTPPEEAMLVGRASRLQSLEISNAHLQGKLEEARGRLASLEEQRREQAQALATLEEVADWKGQELHRAEAMFGSAQADSDKLRQEMEVLKTEETETSVDLREIHTELERWEKELAVKEQQLESHQSAIRQGQETIAAAGRQREEVSVALAGAKGELASLDEVAASRRSSLQVLEQSVESLEARAQERRAELAQLELRQAQLEEACVRIEQELAGLEMELSRVQAQADEAARRREEAQRAAQEQEQEFLQVRRRLDQLQSKLHAQEMEQAQLTFQKEQIGTRLLQIYQINLDEMPEELAEPDAAEPDPEQMRARAEELSQKLQKMGPVNLASIEEERELQNRFEFLSAQQADLTKAKDDIHEALTKISRTTRAMFRETFEAIHKEFQGTFKQLFGGGEARLVLMDEEDLLESGIEIIARPPGKPLQPISLLSGGEKALTAIALLFAIFKIKPSPFCLLDEIDAPLDEANVDRFTRALKEFLKDSQFIIITHNKKTMGMADVMYGVTMQEMGVSKIVSVKFKKDGTDPTQQQLQPVVSRN
ncbi:MAG: chromosome segregation protein SMC [Candidatus Omnitrophota bacterium]|nr:chromosome segregation protein SMC [Candidatus Omnitrophota bacterium]